MVCQFVVTRVTIRCMFEPQPSIYPFGIRIDEPVTALTDLFVTAVCFYAWQTLQQQAPLDKTRTYVRNYFFLLGIATALGGLIGHGFIYALSFPWKLPGWVVSMLSIAFIERSAIEYVRPLIKPALARFFLVLNAIELVVVMGITFYTLNFQWVEFHSGYGLLVVVLSFHFYSYRNTCNRGSYLMMVAVGIATLAAIVFTYQLAPHRWFNHMDVSHLLMCVSVYYFHLGVQKLERSASHSPSEKKKATG